LGRSFVRGATVTARRRVATDNHKNARRDFLGFCSRWDEFLGKANSWLQIERGDVARGTRGFTIQTPFF